MRKINELYKQVFKVSRSYSTRLTLCLTEAASQVLQPAFKEQARLQRMRAIEEKARAKEEAARKRLQEKENYARACELLKQSKVPKKETPRPGANAQSWYPLRRR